jgi:hypothetical protein
VDVFGRGTAEPSRPLLTPGICWVCENSPQQEGMKVIDTRRNARAGGSMSHEAVRKYVCEPCARELGAAMGMVSEDKYLNALTYHEIASKRVNELEDELERVRSQQTQVVNAQAFVDQLKTELAAIRVPIGPDVPAQQTK